MGPDDTRPIQSSTSYNAPPPPEYDARPVGTPGSVVTAGVLLLVFATLATLFGLLMIFVGVMVTSFDSTIMGPGFDSDVSAGAFDQVMGMAQGILIGFAVVVLLIAAAHFAAGIGILKRRGWARITGIVLSVLALLIVGFGIVSSLATIGQPVPFDSTAYPGMTEEQLRDMATTGTIVGTVISGIIFLAYAYTAFILARRGDVFS